MGIGTTAPAQLLNVAGPARINPTATPGSPAAGDLFVDSAAANVLKYHNGSSWVSVVTGGVGDFLANGTVPMTGNLRLNGNYLSGDGGSEGIFVDAGGNVGIGTTSPAGLMVRSTQGNLATIFPPRLSSCELATLGTSGLEQVRPALHCRLSVRSIQQVQRQCLVCLSFREIREPTRQASLLRRQEQAAPSSSRVIQSRCSICAIAITMPLLELMLQPLRLILYLRLVRI